MFAAIWRECLGIEIETPFPRMTYAEADRRFGTDKPDTRFGLELEDATAATRGSEFGVFAGAEAVRFLRVPQAFSRASSRSSRRSRRSAARRGSRGSSRDETGELRSPIAKFLSQASSMRWRRAGRDAALRCRRLGGDSRVLGHLRLHLGRELGLIDDERSRSSG